MLNNEILEMSILKLILVNVGEEASEVAKEALKGVRYSMLERLSGDGFTSKNNGENLIIEFHQLQGLIEFLQESGSLPIFDEETIKRIKKEKLARTLNSANRFEKI